jgi:hypothetical protein
MCAGTGFEDGRVAPGKWQSRSADNRPIKPGDEAACARSWIVKYAFMCCEQASARLAECDRPR